MSADLSALAVGGPALVSACLPQIQQAIAFVCRQRRLTRDEAHDLASDVHVRLLQHDAAVLRRYRGESSLNTFLVVVIQRVLLDARIARAGKWRPSAVARRLGRVAIHLERLVFYDGLSLAEAGPLVREHTGATHTDDELHFLLMLLPARRRRRMVGERELRTSQRRRTPRTVSRSRRGRHGAGRSHGRWPGSPTRTAGSSGCVSAAAGGCARSPAPTGSTRSGSTGASSGCWPRFGHGGDA